MKLSSAVLGSLSLFCVATASLTMNQAEAYPRYTYSAPFYRNTSDHLFAEVNYADSLVMLEDGSQWRVAGEDYLTLISWRLHDPAYITPNYYYSDFKFYITNQADGSYVLANLVNAPIRGAPYTFSITGMDLQSYGKKGIHLSNGTFWSVSDLDAHILQNWVIDDLVIIGRNSEWFTSNRNILINVSTNNFVRARRI